MPLDLDERRCRCGRPLDTLGDHRAACSTVGLLPRRAVPLERAWARVCREAGGRVKAHRYLNDMNLPSVDSCDSRRLEVVVSGLPLHHGAQIAVDATQVSPLGRTGRAHPRTHWRDGAALERAVRKKEDKYPELLRARRCRLLVTGQEVDGRWSEEA